MPHHLQVNVAVAFCIAKKVHDLVGFVQAVYEYGKCCPSAYNHCPLNVWPKFAYVFSKASAYYLSYFVNHDANNERHEYKITCDFDASVFAHFAEQIQQIKSGQS